MQKGKQRFVVQGMAQDNDISIPNGSENVPQKAYEIVNMRLSNDELSDAMVLTNEKGTKLIDIVDNGLFNDHLEGETVGTAEVGDYLIVFTHQEQLDRIYRLKWNENKTKLLSTLLAAGLFGFGERMETISYYENEKVLKVYWVDGVNCLRVINVLDGKFTDTAKRFDATPEIINDSTSVEITKKYSSDGVFSPGTIQYFATYSNKYLAESNVFYQSSLYYINSQDNGGDEPNTTSTCSFDIKLTDLDTEYGYVNIYGVSRSDRNGEVMCRLVKSLRIPEDGKIVFTDNGTNTALVGSDEIISHTNVTVIPSTFAVKSNTLFLGNLKQQHHELDITHEMVTDSFVGDFVVDDTKKITTDIKGHYANNNQLNYSNDQITTFKSREKYRFGVQFQHKRGYWSEVFWIGDHTNDKAPESTDANDHIDIRLSHFKGKIKKEILRKVHSEGFVKIRPVVVYPQEFERECVWQGIVNPTVFNTETRLHNSVFSQASWFFRPNSETQCIDDDGSQVNDGNFKYEQHPLSGDDKAVFQYGHYKCLPDCTNKNAEIQCNLYHPGFHNDCFVDKDKTESSVAQWGRFYMDSFFVDQSVFTFNSPEIEFEQKEAHGKNIGYKFRIVGAIPISGSASRCEIVTKGTANTYRDMPTVIASGLRGNKNYSRKIWDIQKNDSSVIGATTIWSDEISEPADVSFKNPQLSGAEYGSATATYFESGFMVYPWHRDGCLNNNIQSYDPDCTGTYITKKLSNMRYSPYTQYFDDAINIDLEDSVSWNSSVDAHVPLTINGEKKMYLGTVDQALKCGTGSDDVGTSISSNIVMGSWHACKNFLRFILFPIGPGWEIPTSFKIYMSDCAVANQTNYVKNYASNHWVPMFSVYYIKNGDDFDLVLDSQSPQSRNSGFFKLYTGSSYYSDELDDQWSDEEKKTGLTSVTISDATQWYDYYCKHSDTSLSTALANGGCYLRIGWHRGEKVYDPETKELKVTLRLLSRRFNTRDKNRKAEFLLTVTAKELCSKSKGYPIVCTEYYRVGEEEPKDKILTQPKAKINKDLDYVHGREGVSLRYVSTPHIVSSIKQSNSSIQYILPSKAQPVSLNGVLTKEEYSPVIDNNPEITDEEKAMIIQWQAEGKTEDEIQELWDAYLDTKPEPEQQEQTITTSSVDLKPFWQDEQTFTQIKPIRNISSLYTNHNDYLLIGEYYKDSENKFGGTSQESLESNNWCVGGQSVYFDAKDDVELDWTEGDTYYQRYDCLKTHAKNKDDKNQVVEILSCMVETRINIDGRYDKLRRGGEDFTDVNNTNFNKLNIAYTQDDNYLSYKAFDKDSINADEFHNDILWTEKKVSGDYTDKWMNLYLQNSMSAENQYGKLTRLVSNGSGLYAINDNSISKIIYSETAGIQDANGKDILFGISDEVQGIQVLTNSYGSQNKWSIALLDDAIVGVDNLNKCHYVLSKDQVIDLGVSYGMRSWFRTHNDYGLSLYNKNIREMYYVHNGKDCLTLGQSSSLLSYTGFFSYENMSFLNNYLGTTLMITNKDGESKIWQQHAGNNNEFFGVTQPYSVTYRSNYGQNINKIFSNVEFRADSYNDELVVDTFDTLRCWNEYQDTQDCKLKFLQEYRDWPTDLKKKFRIWRANIGRDQRIIGGKLKNRDRIQNTWAFVKIAKNNPEYEKTILHDFEVVYYLRPDSTFKSEQ